MKCDETKPSCRRCIRRNGVCDGYEHSDSGIRKQNLKRLAPRSLYPAINCVPTKLLFRSALEKAWFETWFLLSSELCGDELSEIFAVTVTQLSNQDAILRQAILAVGSLKFTLDQASDVPPGQTHRAGSQYETALSRYGTALRAVTAMPANESTISTILLCCILFICFDLLDENHQSVHNHIQHGSRILQQFLCSKSQGVDLRTCIASPAPYVINDSIIHIFQRCISISYVHRAPQLPSHQSTPQLNWTSGTSTFLVSQMAGEFQDLREAVKWLDLIQNAFLTTLFTPDATLRPQGTLDDDEKWQKERLGFLKILHDWSVAFWGVERLAERKRGTNPERFAQALLLRMQWHNSYIFVYTSHYRDYKALVEMENMFRAIVNLAKVLPNDLSKGKLVTPLTISGPVLPLFG